MNISNEKTNNHPDSILHEELNTFVADMSNILPKFAFDAINSHLKNIKNHAYHEGRVVLLKMAISQKIRIHTNFLSDLSLEDLYKEHLFLGPFMDEKSPPGNYVKDLEEQLLTSEKSKEEKLKDMLKSREKISEIFTPASLKIINDLLSRTQNDIKANVGRVNQNIFNNAKSNYDMNRILSFRWRSFFKDIALGDKKITTNPRQNKISSSISSGYLTSSSVFSNSNSKSLITTSEPLKSSFSSLQSSSDNLAKYNQKILPNSFASMTPSTSKNSNDAIQLDLANRSTQKMSKNSPKNMAMRLTSNNDSAYSRFAHSPGTSSTPTKNIKLLAFDNEKTSIIPNRIGNVSIDQFGDSITSIPTSSVVGKEKSFMNENSMNNDGKANGNSPTDLKRTLDDNMSKNRKRRRYRKQKNVCDNEN